MDDIQTAVLHTNLPDKRIVVGQAYTPHRCLINHHKKDQHYFDIGGSMNIFGWKEYIAFKAFSEQKPGTKRIVVAHCEHPKHRCMINHKSKDQEYFDEGGSMNILGWKEYLDFWAYKEQMPGTIRIVVGQTQEPHRVMINHDSQNQVYYNNGGDMNILGWTEIHQFWAYPDGV